MDLTSDDAFAANLAALPAAPSTPPPPGLLASSFEDMAAPNSAHLFGQNIRAGFKRTIENDLPFGISDDWVMGNQYAPLIETLNKVQQRQPMSAFSNGTMIGNPYGGGERPPDFHGRPNSQQDFLDYIWGQVAQAKAQNPAAFGQLPQSHAEMIADAQAEQRAAIASQQQLALTSGPITGTVGQFVGQAGGSFADPVNLAATVAGFPAAEGLLKTALIEGAGNVVVDAAGLPGRTQHYKDIGEPMSAGDVETELAASGAFGAGLGVGGKLIARVLGLKGHALADEFEAQNPDAAPSQRTATALVRDQADIAASNPFAPGPQGEDLHQNAVVQALGALDDGNPGLVPDYSDHVEATARANAPEDFAELEAAEGDRNSAAQKLEELQAAQTAEANEALPVSVQRALSQVGGVESRLSKPDLENLAAARAKLNTSLTSDTPEMAAVRQQLMAADVRMRDAAPKVAAALRDAKTQIPPTDLNGEGGTVFQTAKGSVYRQHADGTTSRNKAARSDLGHEGQEGPQPRSQATYYVTPEDADQLSLFQTQGGARMAVVPRDDGTIGVQYLDGDGAGKFEKRTVVNAERVPRVGLLPVETWNDGTRVHFGNEIVNVRDDSTPVPAAIEASHAANTRTADPEALARFGDPVKKPEAFTQQADDLARELAPPPEKVEAESPDGETAKPDEFGPAQFQIDALRRMDQDRVLPDAHGPGDTSLKNERAVIERQARAVERLRGCIEGGE